METRVRFAPSPTGQVHIGNIRAAIFNWLYARHCGGKFLLRIEDTDRERSSPEAIEQLLHVMQWLGLDWDEEPLYQSARVDAHTRAAERLLDQGSAYRHAKGEGGEAVIFRIPWESDPKRNIRDVGEVSVALHPEVAVRIDATGISFAHVSKKGKAVPQDAALAGFRQLIVYNDAGQCIYEMEPQIADILSGQRRVELDKPARMTFFRREVVFLDLVKGELAKPLDSLRDPVIIRSDGSPVFHLANVCDDITQGITHIVRGDDHVENTYRHLFLFQALSHEPPAYAHLPMIVNAAGKPYSKRDGDAYVGEFREKGYLPEGLFNYLTLLGWSPGDDREKLPRDTIADLFSLDRIGSAPAQLDINKLLDLNGQCMAELPLPTFLQGCRDAVRGESWAGQGDSDYFERAASLMQSRTKLFTQATDWDYFFVDELRYDEKAVRKSLQKPGVVDVLAQLRQRLSGIEFDEATVEATIHETTTACAIPQGKLNLPIRVAVTGINVGAGLYEILALLGKDRVLRRLDHAVSRICEA